MPEIDHFESRIPLEQLETLLDLGVVFGFDPTASIEIEEYFVNLLKGFKPGQMDLKNWLIPRITASFRYLTEKPKWVQSPNWQMGVIAPMLFIGQLDCPATKDVLHDNASFYIFYEPNTGEIRTIIQIG